MKIDSILRPVLMVVIGVFIGFATMIVGFAYSMMENPWGWLFSLLIAGTALGWLGPRALLGGCLGLVIPFVGPGFSGLMPGLLVFCVSACVGFRLRIMSIERGNASTAAQSAHAIDKT